ncbi:MAG: carbon-nitrogen hydrolase family protein [Firmicutes bacterium]|nr:carbon-nitrogen hydrolase family protein [Bacillota bacterium]
MKACLAQLYTVKGDPAANLAKMSAAIKEAAAKGADLVCFSELFYCGYDISREELRGLAIYVDGPELAKVRAMAADAGVHVLISYPEKDKMSDDVFISASLIDDAGNILLNHRKTYRWGDEKDKVSGGSGYEVCDTKFGKIGVLICYEIEFPEPARILMLQGAELILTTSAFTYVENMPTYLSALAIQNQCYVLSTNDVREESPKRGASCVLDQYGKVIEILSDNEGMLYCDIDLNAPGRRDSDPHMGDLDRETFRMMVELCERNE